MGFLVQTRNTALVNILVNHQDVRPYVGLPEEGPLDMQPIVERPENLFLLGTHGGYALIWSAPGVYEIHTFITRRGRGAWAAQAAQDLLEYARSRGARMVWTKVPPTRPNVEAYTRRAGLVPAGYTIDTFGEPYAVFLKEF